MGAFSHVVVRPAGLPAISFFMVFPPDVHGIVEVSIRLKQEARSAVAKWAKHFGVDVVEVEEWKDEASGVRGLEYTATQETDRYRVRVWTNVVVHPGAVRSASGRKPGAAE